MTKAMKPTPGNLKVCQLALDAQTPDDFDEQEAAREARSRSFDHDEGYLPDHLDDARYFQDR